MSMSNTFNGTVELEELAILKMTKHFVKRTGEGMLRQTTSWSDTKKIEPKQLHGEGDNHYCRMINGTTEEHDGGSDADG